MTKNILIYEKKLNYVMNNGTSTTSYAINFCGTIVFLKVIRKHIAGQGFYHVYNDVYNNFCIYSTILM